MEASDTDIKIMIYLYQNDIRDTGIVPANNPKKYD